MEVRKRLGISVRFDGHERFEIRLRKTPQMALGAREALAGRRSLDSGGSSLTL